MRHDRAEDSSNVSGQEADPQLRLLGALALGDGDHMLVQRLNGALEAGKLHHRVCRERVVVSDDGCSQICCSKVH